MKALFSVVLLSIFTFSTPLLPVKLERGNCSPNPWVTDCHCGEKHLILVFEESVIISNVASYSINCKGKRDFQVPCCLIVKHTLSNDGDLEIIAKREGHCTVSLVGKNGEKIVQTFHVVRLDDEEIEDYMKMLVKNRKVSLSN